MLAPLGALTKKRQRCRPRRRARGAGAGPSTVTPSSIGARALITTGANVKRAGQRALDEILATSGVARERIGFVVGTGYGRYKIEAGDTQVTEISCHARGAQMLFPGTRTVIDMGGQDTKGIRVGPEGEVEWTVEPTRTARDKISHQRAGLSIIPNDAARDEAADV